MKYFYNPKTILLKITNGLLKILSPLFLASLSFSFYCNIYHFIVHAILLFCDVECALLCLHPDGYCPIELAADIASFRKHFTTQAEMGNKGTKGPLAIFLFKLLRHF